MKSSTQELLSIIFLLIAIISTSACGSKNVKAGKNPQNDDSSSISAKQEVSILDTGKCKLSFDSILNRNVYENVPEMPEFPGGTEAMYTYLYNNMKFEMTKDSFQGSVMVSFIIESDGSIKDAYAPRPYFKNGLSSLEKGLIEIVRRMPKWKPAKCNDKPVPIKFTLPIKF